MLTKLTPENREFMQKIKTEYINRLTEDTTIDMPQLKKGLAFLYGKLNLIVPEIEIVNDPLKAIVEAKKLCKEVTSFHCFGIGYDSGWCAFYDFFTRIGVLKSEAFNSCLDLIKCGAFSYVFLDKKVFVITRPLFIKKNPANQKHCSDGPAIKWEGGFEMYYLNGIKMTKEQVMTPAEQLNAQDILKETNVDVRRELIRKMGIENFVTKANAKVLDKQGDYELVSIYLSDEVPDARYLKMKNPSIGIYHVEGVEAECDTVQKAINWRAGDITKEWRPSILS